MKRRLSTILALALLALPAASPFLLRGTPRTNDLSAHLFRTFFLIRAVEWGGIWPRWSPDLLYGHGYPVFSFFPSLFHWVLALLHKTGLPLFTAYRVHMYLLFWLTAVTSYLLAAKIFKSRTAGWTAALIYTYSPYLLYDSHIRGSGPELQALALLPLLIFLLWQISDTEASESGFLPKSRLLKVVMTAVTFAIIFLTHPIAYQLLIPLGMWLLIKAGFASKKSGVFQKSDFLAVLIPPAVGIGLGGLMVVFHWLPAFVEVDHTRVNLSISQGYTYQANFLSLLDMLRWPQLPADPTLVNPPVVRALPVIGLLWAVALILWRWRIFDQNRRQIVVAWTAVLLLSVWLITPYSVFIWDNFPLLSLTLYPWRLLGAASMAIALLAASTTPARTATVLLTLLVIISTIPWLYPPRTAMPEEVSLGLAMSDEIPPYLIGTTTLGEFLPEWVEELPPQEPLRGDLLSDGNPDRLQAQDGLIWTQHKENPIAATYTITAVRPLTLTYRQFYFPGWKAVVDGEEIPIIPSSPHGLITIPLSAGVHETAFTFGMTTVRLIGIAISSIAVLILLILAVIGWYGDGQIRIASTNSSSLFFLPLTAVLLILVWLFFTVVDTPLRRPTLLPDGVLGKPSITPFDYAGELRLLSVESPATAASADPIPLTLYWQPQRKIGVPYDVGVQIVDEAGTVWSVANGRPPDWRFVGQNVWPIDGYQMDQFVVELMDGTPPGRYFVYVGLVRSDIEQTVAAHRVAELIVDEAATGTDRPLEEGMDAVVETAVSQHTRLLGSRLDRKEAAPGDPARVTTLWHIDGEMGSLPILQLLADDGTVLLEKPVPLAADAKPGERLRAENTLRLPAGLSDGTHNWRVLWGGQSIKLGKLTITAPERVFTVPDMETAIDTPFYTPDGTLFATLLGGSFTDSSTTIFWRVEAETAVSYRIYLHLLDADGKIITQSDGEPSGWTRPTTGWLPDEIVKDIHPLQMGGGASELRIGLYDPQTGERLNGEAILKLGE